MRTARRCCRVTRSAKRSRAASRSPARTRALMLAASSESLDVGGCWTRAGVFGAVDDTERASSPGLATRRGGVLIGIRQPETAVYPPRINVFPCNTIPRNPEFHGPSSEFRVLETARGTQGTWRRGTRNMELRGSRVDGPPNGPVRSAFSSQLRLVKLHEI
jgi:hypothetical protein